MCHDLMGLNTHQWTSCTAAGRLGIYKQQTLVAAYVCRSSLLVMSCTVECQMSLVENSPARSISVIITSVYHSRSGKNLYSKHMHSHTTNIRFDNMPPSSHRVSGPCLHAFNVKSGDRAQCCCGRCHIWPKFTQTPLCVALAAKCNLEKALANTILRVCLGVCSLTLITANAAAEP